MNKISPTLEVRQLFDRDSCTYTYLLIDSGSKEAAIIDPVMETLDRDLQTIRELGLELLFSIETHAHADHITASGKIRQHTGAKLVYGINSGIQSIDVAIADGQTLSVGQYEIVAIETPGHTNACTSFYADGNLFTGDALLIRGCGRTDFQGGDPGVLYDSIRQKLFSYDDSTVIFPGHDYSGRTRTTVGEEKRWNPRLGANRSREDFVDLMNNLNLDMPKRINEAVPANMNVGIDFNPEKYLLRDFDMNDLYKVWQNKPENVLIVDNRTEKEFSEGHVPGSINIPMGTENEHLDQFSNPDDVIIYCRSGRRAQTTLTNLSFQGLDHITCVSHSGMPDWIKSGYPVEN